MKLSDMIVDYIIIPILVGIILLFLKDIFWKKESK